MPELPGFYQGASVVGSVSGIGGDVIIKPLVDALEIPVLRYKYWQSRRSGCIRRVFLMQLYGLETFPFSDKTN